jgi:AcrR family transcriptional regulator
MVNRESSRETGRYMLGRRAAEKKVIMSIRKAGAVERDPTPKKKIKEIRRTLPAKARTPRRTRTDDSETRDRLLDAAERLMCEEGYAAVTTRRLGATAGVHPQLVHYYFAGMDDLFVELWRRFTGHYLAQQAQAFMSSNPVRTVWEHDVDPRGATLSSELMAAARHRSALRDEIMSSVEKIRIMQASALAPAMDAYQLRDIFRSPAVLALCMVGLARILVVEGGLGITAGHAEAREVIAEWLDRLESRGEAAKAPGK